MSKIAVIGIIGNSVFLPVDHFHIGGETVEASSVHFEPGGKGFNQAVAAARCGAEVSFLAAVGLEYREEFADFLDKEQISHTLIFKDDSTAFAAIVTDKSGSNHVTVYQGAQLCGSDVLLFKEKIKNAVDPRFFVFKFNQTKFCSRSVLLKMKKFDLCFRIVLISN